MPERLPTFADRVARVLENSSCLDGLADRIGALVPERLRVGRARDIASGTPLGHPLHPAIVAVPMGAWLSAGMLDLVGGHEARRGARRLVGVGVLTAAPTALAGWSDWLDTEGAERRVGLAHAAANATALGLYASSWLSRGKGHHRRGVALAMVGSAALAVGGWLGGHLSYALGVGVDTTAFQHMDSTWADLGAAGELDGEGRLHGEAQGTRVVVVRVADGVHALADRCTHRGAPLHEGELRGGCIVCPWHGSAFDLETGSVANGPATRPQARFEARIIDDRVQVRRADEVRALRSNPV